LSYLLNLKFDFIYIYIRIIVNFLMVYDGDSELVKRITSVSEHYEIDKSCGGGHAYVLDFVLKNIDNLEKGDDFGRDLYDYVPDKGLVFPEIKFNRRKKGKAEKFQVCLDFEGVEDFSSASGMTKLLLFHARILERGGKELYLANICPEIRLEFSTTYFHSDLLFLKSVDSFRKKYSRRE